MSFATGSYRRDLPSGSLLCFLIGTFAITWGIVGGYILFPEVMVPLFGEISGRHPLYFIATWGPAIAALTLVSATAGVQGLRRFLTGLSIWRCAPVWWLFIPCLSG